MNLNTKNMQINGRFNFAILSSGIFLIFSLGSVSADQDEITSKETNVGKDDQARVYRNPEERRESGLETEITDWLKFSGLVESEKEYFEENLKNNSKNREYGNANANLQLVFELNYSTWLGAELVYEIDYDGHQENAMWDEAFIYFDFDDLGLAGEVGRVSVPFGEYYSHFVTGPMLEFGETIGNGLVIDYSILDVLEISAFAVDSKFEKIGKNTNYDWGANIEYISETESMRLGVSYLSDLAESDERFLRNKNNNYISRVSAWNAYALLGYDSFEISAEIIHANNHFREFENQEDKPFAYNIELAYFPTPTIQLALRYEGSDEFSEQPDSQYGVAVSWRPINRISVTAEYLHGKYKNDFVFDDDDIEIDDRDLLAIQASFEF